MAMEIGETMVKITEEMTIDRNMVTKGTEIGVEVRIEVDPGLDIGVFHRLTQI